MSAGRSENLVAPMTVCEFTGPPRGVEVEERVEIGEAKGVADEKKGELVVVVVLGVANDGAVVVAAPNREGVPMLVVVREGGVVKEGVSEGVEKEGNEDVVDAAGAVAVAPNGEKEGLADVAGARAEKREGAVEGAPNEGAEPKAGAEAVEGPKEEGVGLKEGVDVVAPNDGVVGLKEGVVAEGVMLKLKLKLMLVVLARIMSNTHNNMGVFMYIILCMCII